MRRRRRDPLLEPEPSIIIFKYSVPPGIPGPGKRLDRGIIFVQLDSGKGAPTVDEEIVTGLLDRADISRVSDRDMFHKSEVSLSVGTAAVSASARLSR